MQTLEELHRLCSAAEDQARELRTTLNRIVDLPAHSESRSVYKDLISSGHNRESAWEDANRIVRQRREAHAALVDMQGEIEILTSIADDLIGTNGRLI